MATTNAASVPTAGAPLTGRGSMVALPTTLRFNIGAVLAITALI